MEVKELKLNGVYGIILEPLTDERGFFMRTYDRNIFKESGLNKEWVQENHSMTLNKGTIRGLHFQLPPFAETKLVRCIRGEVLDVFVDLRKDSETFGKWDSVILSEENYKMILIPRGFAHGFYTLTDNCEVTYKVDNYYSPAHEIGLLWNDTDLKIKWPEENPILSEKDKKNLTLKEFMNKFNSIEV
ncbi:MAG: dTDP-4-dehydrorhamnose 3,5-epimerase [Bacteroidota bacterium]